MDYNEALKLLGLSQGYSEDERKKAYRVLVKKFHPDLNPTPAAEIIMRRINEANDFLENYKPEQVTLFTHNTIFDIVLS